VACLPSPTGVGQPTACTATVTDASSGSSSIPSGSANWTRSGTGAGSFSPASCTLTASGSSAKCSVTYTPASGTGNHTITAAYGGDVKHNAASGNVTLTVNSISASTLVVSAASGTVGGNTSLSAMLKKSDGTALGNKTVSFSLNGTSAGTAVTNASGVATLSNASLSGIAVGSYPGGVVATFGGDSAANGSTGSNTLTVNPACTAPSATTDPTAKSIIYGDNASFTAAASGNPTPTIAWQVSTDGGASWQPVSGESSTTLTLTKPTVSQGGNRYRAVFANDCGGTKTATSDPATLTVAKKTVTGSFTAEHKVYDGTRDATINGRSLDGAVEDDDVSLTDGNALFADKHVGTDKTVTGTGFELDGDDAGNYQLTGMATTKANITRKPLAGSFTANDKVYDGTRTATVKDRSLSGVISGETVNLTVTNPLFDTKDVGTDKDVTGDLGLSGADAGNYSVNGSHTTKAAITAWDAQGHGFYQPVGIANSTFIPAGSTPPAPAPSATTVWNAAKGGSTIPLKFNVYAGGVEKTSTSDVSGFSAVKLSACATGSGEDVVDFVTSGSTVLRYDTTDRQFVQNWKTPTVSGESCYRATATFADGSTLSAFFKLRK
jgi:hypothetical protein